MAHLADCPRFVLLWDSAPGLTNSEKYEVVGEERSPPGVGNLTQKDTNLMLNCRLSPQSGRAVHMGQFYPLHLYIQCALLFP